MNSSTLTEWIGRHRRSLLFLLLLPVLAGIGAALSLPVALFPNIQFPRVRVSLDAGDRPAHPEPVRLWNVAFGDGDEAREPRFRGEQIVIRGVQASGAVCVRRTIADRQQPALLVIEQEIGRASCRERV